MVKGKRRHSADSTESYKSSEAALFRIPNVRKASNNALPTCECPTHRMINPVSRRQRVVCSKTPTAGSWIIPTTNDGVVINATSCACRVFLGLSRPVLLRCIRSDLMFWQSCPSMIASYRLRGPNHRHSYVRSSATARITLRKSKAKG